MTTLLRPDNNQPATVLKVTPARVCLDTTYITPACRWFTLAELTTVNERAAIAAACKTPEAAPAAYRPAWEATPYAIVIWKPLASNIMHVDGFTVRTWGSNPTVYHESMRAA